MMNETLKTIYARRSVRAYKPEQITDDELETVLKAGEYAPSANNQQSQLFVAIQKKELLDELAALGMKVKHADSSPYYGAPTVILVFAKAGCSEPFADGCLALENMFLAAASIGLGSCWINCGKHIFATDEGKALKKRLGGGDDYITVGSCILGYPAQELGEAAPRKDDYVIYIK